MRILVIAYDLHSPGQNYSKVEEKIKTLGSERKKILNTTWLLYTQNDPEAIRNSVQSVMDSNDKILVADVTGKDSAWEFNSTELDVWFQSKFKATN